MGGYEVRHSSPKGFQVSKECLSTGHTSNSTEDQHWAPEQKTYSLGHSQLLHNSPELNWCPTEGPAIRAINVKGALPDLNHGSTQEIVQCIYWFMCSLVSVMDLEVCDKGV